MHTSLWYHHINTETFLLTGVLMLLGKSEMKHSNLMVSALDSGGAFLYQSSLRSR